MVAGGTSGEDSRSAIPASGIKVGQYSYGIAQPLGQAAEAAATHQPGWCSCSLWSPPRAPAPSAPPSLTTSTWATIASSPHRLIASSPDESAPSTSSPTRSCSIWLGYRRTRWPDTANPHLLINQQSAMGTGPVSTIYFAKTKLRGQAAILERPRVDRQLEEALITGPTRCTWQRCSASTQDRHPRRRKRPLAPHHQGRGARSRQFPRTARAGTSHRAWRLSGPS